MPSVKQLQALLAGYDVLEGSTSPSVGDGHERNEENERIAPSAAPAEFPRIYRDDPTKPTKPAAVPFDPEAYRPREPGDDDDQPTSQAWLAEFNRLIGRPQP